MKQKNPDRYLKIVMWARGRYTRIAKGVPTLTIKIGYTLSPYSIIEKLAWDKYIKNT